MGIQKGHIVLPAREETALDRWKKDWEWDREVGRQFKAGRTFELRKYLDRVDAEFISNRRDYIPGAERIAPEDRTLINGFITESLGDPEVQAQFESGYFEQWPVELMDNLVEKGGAEIE